MNDEQREFYHATYGIQYTMTDRDDKYEYGFYNAKAYSYQPPYSGNCKEINCETLIPYMFRLSEFNK